MECHSLPEFQTKKVHERPSDTLTWQTGNPLMHYVPSGKLRWQWKKTTVWKMYLLLKSRWWFQPCWFSEGLIKCIVFRYCILKIVGTSTWLCSQLRFFFSTSGPPRKEFTNGPPTPFGKIWKWQDSHLALAAFFSGGGKVVSTKNSAAWHFPKFITGWLVST